MHNPFSSTLFRSGVLLFLGVLAVVPARSQETREASIGSMYYRTNEAFTSDELLYPIGVPNVSTNMLNTYGITVGARRSWTTPAGEPSEYQTAQVMEDKFNDFESVVVPEPGAFKRVFRNPYPVKTIDNFNFTQAFDRIDEANPSTPSDVMFYNKANTWPNVDEPLGIQIERWAYLFANDAYDDMVILEYRFTNTSDEPRQDVWIGLNAAPHSEAHYPGDLWGDYYGVTYNKYANGDASADSMRLWYAWSADQIRTEEQDDKGEPNGGWGYFTEPQFIAHVVLHADACADDTPECTADDPTMPRKAGWSQRDFVANLNEASHTDVYNYLSESWNTGSEVYDRFENADGEEVTDGMYRVLNTAQGAVAPNGIDLDNYDPESEQEKNNLMSFGPYQMDPGEDVHIVMAFTGGMIPSRLAIDAGRAYDGGQASRETFGIQPLPAGRSYTDMHGHPIVQDGNVYRPQDLGPDGTPTAQPIARAGETYAYEGTGEEAIEAVINIGQEIVFETASDAIQLWKRSSVQFGQGDFDIDYSPAAPSLTGVSGTDLTTLQWSDNQQDARGGPITGYKIYRGYKRPSTVTQPTDTTFILLADIAQGDPAFDSKEYVDTDVVRGEDYYYYITAYNDQGIESSSFQNRTGTNAEPQREALTPQSPPNDDWKNQVIVVPNPYHPEAVGNYGRNDRRLNFLNLPAFANIHIYTVAGDRVQTIRHNSPGGVGNVDWERQQSLSTLEIVSGLYIFVVEELDGPDGSPTGESTTGKFVVVK